MDTLLTLRPMLYWSRLWAIALAFALLVAAAGAGAAPADATDEAFGALLAMPGAQPKEGGWIIPQAPAPDEPALIARWQRLRKEGADFNAMRHGGTLLAHAIRAGKQSAALWLLHNGADPRKVLRDGGEDAYTLARKYERPAVVAALETQFGFKPAPAAASGAKAATPSGTPPAAAPVTLTRVEYAVALLKQSPDAPDEKTQQAWRRHAATLSDEEFRSVFKDGENFFPLVRLTQDVEGGLEEALARLPVDQVRRRAQVIADALAKGSRISYGDSRPPRIEFSGASRSWPALWRRIERPLNYEQWPDLASAIPPELWPGLFASGYAKRDAEVTGCLLAAVDLPTLKALWPSFQRYFANAREEAAGLVLSPYRIAQTQSRCGDYSSQAETAAKLAFLRASGVTAPVYGLYLAPFDGELALAEMIAEFFPQQESTPRLVSVAPDCHLSLDGRWWKALVKVRSVGWGIPPAYVQVVQAPGFSHCGLFISGNQHPDRPSVYDSFEIGPDREPYSRCGPDLPNDGEIWVMGRDGIQPIRAGFETRGTGASLNPVLDSRSGKRFVLNYKAQKTWCEAEEALLPEAFEWQTDEKGPKLMPSRDNRLVERLLRQQCRVSVVASDSKLTCPGLDRSDAPEAENISPRLRLRSGAVVPLQELLDDVGADRRAAYKAAIAARDRAQLRQLREDGIPAWWTAAEIGDLAKADFPLEEKRRRIALLFADADHLTEALSTTSLESLATWLPRQDWAPILRIIAKEPDRWFQAVKQVRPMVKDALGCDLDRAQGFLCGGGLQTD